jgi:hypothetical protein
MPDILRRLWADKPLLFLLLGCVMLSVILSVFGKPAWQKIKTATYDKFASNKAETERLTTALSEANETIIGLQEKVTTLSTKVSNYEKGESFEEVVTVATDAKGRPIRNKTGEVQYNRTIKKVSNASGGVSTSDLSEFERQASVTISDLTTKVEDQAKRITEKDLQISSLKESNESRSLLFRVTGGGYLDSALKLRPCVGVSYDLITLPFIGLPVAAWAGYSPNL